MAITTLDGVLAALQPIRHVSKGSTGTTVAGRPHSSWPQVGHPTTGVQDATLNGAVLSSSGSQVVGQIFHEDPLSGNAYLGRLQTTTPNPGCYVFCDRLWSNGGINITSTSAQAITSPAWPARDVNGSANGDGILLGVEVSATTGNGTPTITVSYTNQANTSGRSGTNIDATSNTSVAGSFIRIGLQAGDTGVRSVQSITLSATWTSGTINLVAYRPIAMLEAIRSNVPSTIDALTGGMPRLYNGTVPFILLISAASSQQNIVANVTEAHG